MMISNEEMKDLKKSYGISQRFGAHFISASLLIWLFIMAVNFTGLSQYYKNVLSLYSSALLVPLALLFSKIYGIRFSEKEHPLNTAGLVFALNQMLYLLVVILVWLIRPDLMLTAYAMVVGAHFLPYSWLYDSLIYRIFSIVITVAAFIFALSHLTFFIPMLMVAADAVMIGLFLGKSKKERIEEIGKVV